MGTMTPQRLMLDTHVLLWMLTDPTQLSKAMRQTLADRSQLLFVSAASAWEITTKQRLEQVAAG
ncbi:MAG: hypothetical protein WKF73_02000 [Nocardioidaceae bacterium]